MPDKRVTATEFARNLSSMLNEVRYREVSIEVWRGKEPVARVVPAAPAAGYPIDRLNALFATLPRLGARNAEAFLEDLQELDRTVGEAGDAWAS
jgi:prevent-host-death family protein